MEHEPQNGQMINLYHASSSALVKHPLIGVGNSQTDFGPAFYTTTNWDQAHEWGTKRAKRMQEWRYGYFIYSYSYIHDGSLSVKFFERPNREWLNLIVKGRSGKRLPYDIIIGPMADDDLHQTLQSYELGIRKCRNDHERKMLEDRTVARLNTFDKTYDQMAFLNQKAADRLVCTSTVQYDIDGEYVKTIFPLSEIRSKTDLHRPDRDKGKRRD